MKLISGIIFVVGLLLGISCAPRGEVDGNSELLSVLTFSRHGDRAPKESFPNDAFFDTTYWPMGYSQLTEYGINRNYKLGQWYRHRYGSFLSEIYSPNEINAYSTNTDRSLLSAQTALTGLYPPRDFQIWNPDLLWQPIPVHTTDRKKDDIIVDKRKCAKWKKLHKKIKKEVYSDLENAHKTLLEYVQAHTGWEEVTPDEIATLYDVMYTYSHYNATFIPDWFSSMDVNDLTVLHDMAVLNVELATYDQHLAKLRTGPFNSFLFHHFDKFVNESNTDATPKYQLVSGHESSLTSILNAFGAFDHQHVGFSYTIIFELRKSVDDVFVNAFYKKDDEVVQLTLLGCEFNCNYQLLKILAKDITIAINDWENECKND